MSTPARVTPAGAAREESERVRLARAARVAALLVPGVRGADAGPRGAFMTETAEGERLEGVTCLAASAGDYDVSLRLVGDLVALHPLGEGVRTAVARAAAATGIEVRSVSVHFAELASDGEL